MDTEVGGKSDKGCLERERTMKMKTVHFAAAALAAVLFLASQGLGAENTYLSVTKSKDGKGVTLTSKKTGGSVDVVLVGKSGRASGSLGVGKVKLGQNRNFIEVAPSGYGIEVRLKGRFAFIPDFHGYEPLYDPVVCKPDLVYVPAKNFFMGVLEGNKGGVMLLWPPDAKQLPALVAEGTGDARRFTKMRVSFDKKPVYVAFIDHCPYVEGLDKKQINYAHKVGSRSYKYGTVPTGWKLPCRACWYTILSKPFPLITKAKKKGAFNIKDGAEFVSGVPADTWWLETKYKNGWNDITNSYRKMSRGEGGSWVLDLEQRFAPYHAAVTYPKTRYIGTPKDFITVSDVLTEALGKETAHKIVDYAGLKGRWVGIPKGQPTVDATCAGWGGLAKYLQAKNKEKFMERLQGCYNFCHYNRKRTDEYRTMAKAVIAACKEAEKNPKLKKLASRLAHTATHIEGVWEHENHEFRETVKMYLKTKKEWGARWFLIFTNEEAEKIEFNDFCFKKIQDHFIKIFNNGNGGNKWAANRAQWTDVGGMLDGIAVGVRRAAARLRQEAALAGVHTPEERAFAIQVRDMVQGALRNFHLKEGWPPANKHYWHQKR